MWKKIAFVVLVMVVVLGVTVRRLLVDFLFSGKNESVKTESVLSQKKEIQSTSVSFADGVIDSEAGSPELVEGVQTRGEPVKLKEKTSETTGQMAEKKYISQSSLIKDVPFTVQAPFGEWNISTFQNGCEEAAVVMAAHWIFGKPLTKEIAKNEIIALSRFEDKKHSQSIDTSAADTEKLFQEYYGIATTEVRADVSLIDIQEALSSWAVVIVPADGRKLKNPNYTQPGPTTHMLVVIGYDAEKKEFITNDSGTKNGKNYRYKEDVLYGAIRDYPTGDHLPIQGISKDMIVVRKP